MKKHDKILMLAKSKLNSIKTLISQAEKDKYEKTKEDLRSENEEYKIMRLRLKKIKNKKIFWGGCNIKSEILLSILHYFSFFLKGGGII